MSETTASTTTATTATSFPIGSRVVLKDLQKAPQFNGKTGKIQSVPNSDGRQQVAVDGEKTMLLKTINLELEPRPIESLSVKELKLILNRKDKHDAITTGMDKSDLQDLVRELKMTEQETAEILAQAPPEEDNPDTSSKKKKKNKAAAADISAEQLQSQAEAMTNMDPDQLRKQAATMRAMDPAVLRRMNPPMANLTDEQIRQAIDQMEFMADNPHMMKSAAEQLKNMSPEELEQQKQAMMGLGPGGAAGNSNNNTSSANSAATSPEDILSRMSPEQLKQQAAMFKSMSPDQLRKMNPHFANMSDDEIKAAGRQMEMMAENPEMMKMVSEQMKNMSPEDLQAIREGRMPSSSGNASGGAQNPNNMDPTKILENMDGKQMKQMLSMMKDDPNILKQMLGPAGATMSEEQLKKSVDAFANMDEQQLDKVLKVMTGFQKVTQPFKKAWNAGNNATGGHLLKIIFAVIALLIASWFMRSSGTSSSSSPSPLSSSESIPVIPVDEEDEF